MNTGTAIRFFASRWRALALVVLAASFLHPINGGGTPYYNVFGFLKPNVNGGSASTPIQFVRTSSLGRIGANSANYVEAQFAAAPAIGNVVVVPVVTYNAVSGTRSVSDNNANVYSLLAETTFNLYTVSIFAGAITKNNLGTPFKVKVNGPSGTKPMITVQASEYSGLSLQYSQNCATAGSGPPVVSVEASGAAEYLLFSLVSSTFVSYSTTFDEPEGWIMRMDAQNNWDLAAGKAVERIVSVSGTHSITYGALDFQWGACIVALKRQ